MDRLALSGHLPRGRIPPRSSNAVVLEDDLVYVGLQDEVPAGDIRKKTFDGCHGNLRISRNEYDDVSRHPIGDCEDIGSVRTGDCQVRSEGDGHSGGRGRTADDGQFSRYVTGVYGQRYVLIENIGRHIDQPCGLRLDNPGIPEGGRQIHDMQRDRRQRPARRCVDEENKQNEDLQRGKDGKRPAGGRILERKRIQKGRTQMNLRHSPQTRPVRNFGKDMKQDGPGRTCDPGRRKSSVWGFRRLWSHGC